MKSAYTLFILCVLLSCKSNHSANENDKNLPREEPTIKSDQIKKDIYFLASDDLKGRDTGSEGIREAANYIKERFENLGLQPYEGDYFDYFEVDGVEAFNVLGVLSGEGELKDEIVIIGAHYDHIGSAQPVNGDEIANGANDNTSGTVAVLALAEELAQKRINQRTVIFTLFSAEEKGLKGSRHLAKRMKNEEKNVFAMINFEMIGVPMKREGLTYLTGYKKSNMADIFNLQDENTTFNWNKDEQMNLFMRSDNYPFYQEFKVPAQTFSTFDFGNFDYYHHVDDEAEQMDIEHITEVVNALLPGVIELTKTNELKLLINE